MRWHIILRLPSLSEMASNRRTRKVTSRGFETIILKDLQCLHKWNIGHLQTYKLGKGYTSPKFSNCDHLLCDETLDDLDDVWATPTKPKCSKRSKPKAGPKLTSPQTPSTASPASAWIVPPNSPAEPEQPPSNPYITYLMRSWDGAQRAAPAPAIPSTVSEAPAHTLTEAAHGPAASSLPESQRDDPLILLNPDDVLVIPDDTREELSTPVASSQSTEKDDEQCVPGDESEDHGCQSQLSHDLALDEDSLFVEDGFIPLETCHEQTPCQMDHVVPKFELEEWFVVVVCFRALVACSILYLLHHMFTHYLVTYF